MILAEVICGLNYVEVLSLNTYLTDCFNYKWMLYLIKCFFLHLLRSYIFDPFFC